MVVGSSLLRRACPDASGRSGSDQGRKDERRQWECKIREAQQCMEPAGDDAPPANNEEQVTEESPGNPLKSGSSESSLICHDATSEDDLHRRGFLLTFVPRRLRRGRLALRDPVPKPRFARRLLAHRMIRRSVGMYPNAHRACGVHCMPLRFELTLQDLHVESA